MRKVYSHENLSILTSAKNLLRLNGIESFIKNEFHASGGHVGWGAVPLELWVHDDAQGKAAVEILDQELSSSNQGSPWTCKHCGEENADSFETCWQCQNVK
jgi:hypothetical protein